MKFDETNTIVKNVLTNEEIEEVYSHINAANESFVFSVFGQTVTNFFLPEAIKNKIIKYCEAISGEENLEISEYQFAKYVNTVDENGDSVIPKLTPHYDDSFKEPRFTFDYQIFSNTSWPIVVEGQEFVLSNNEALTFSGTHQIHWRTPKKFEDKDFMHMIFFHLRKKDGIPTDPAISDIMRSKRKKYREEYNATNNIDDQGDTDA
jgi:hypothetical protein